MEKQNIKTWRKNLGNAAQISEQEYQHYVLNFIIISIKFIIKCLGGMLSGCNIRKLSIHIHDDKLKLILLNKDLFLIQ